VGWVGPIKNRPPGETSQLIPTVRKKQTLTTDHADCTDAEETEPAPICVIGVIGGHNLGVGFPTQLSKFHVRIGITRKFHQSAGHALEIFGFITRKELGGLRGHEGTGAALRRSRV